LYSVYVLSIKLCIKLTQLLWLPYFNKEYYVQAQYLYFAIFITCITDEIPVDDDDGK